MPLRHDQIDDFVEVTLNKYERHKFTDISLGLTKYIAAMLEKDQAIPERGGPLIEFKVKTKNTGNARNTGLYAEDITKVEDVMDKGQVPWAQQTTNFSYDIYEELFQSDQETIVKELVIREHDALSDMADLAEQNLWKAPTGTSDTRPMGIPFWIQLTNSTAAGAFEGTDPSGFTSGRAGISSSTYARWRNWTFKHTAVTTDDYIVKFKRALYETDFEPPVPTPELGYGKSKYHCFTVYDIREPLERLAESRNDNHGADVAKYINQVVIGGVPLTAVPYLDKNTTNEPTFGVNWRCLRPFIKKGCHMRRNPPKPAARQHTVREVHYDNFCNYISNNVRGLFGGSNNGTSIS
jgi:hypothetical protein